MDEVQAGLQSPLDRAAMNALLQQYLPRIRQATAAAKVLHERIAKGESAISEGRSRFGPAIIADAERRLEELRRQLHEQQWWAILSIGALFAFAMGDLAASISREESWSFPAGSYVRIVIPGHINVATELR
jgi:hypothetical protein